jgi:hypothetical protein
MPGVSSNIYRRTYPLISHDVSRTVEFPRNCGGGMTMVRKIDRERLHKRARGTLIMHVVPTLNESALLEGLKLGKEF